MSPDRSSSYLALGALEDSGGRLSEAEASIKRAIQLAPDSVEARLALATLISRHGRQAEAEGELKQNAGNQS